MKIRLLIALWLLAFLVGCKDTEEPIPIVTPEPIRAEIVSSSYAVLHKTGTDWQLSWTVKIGNRTDSPIYVFFRVEFKNANDFVIEDLLRHGQIDGGEIEEFTEELVLPSLVAANIDSMSAVITDILGVIP